jgi:hypothetical protein
MEIRRQGSNHKEGWVSVKSREGKAVQVGLRPDSAEGPAVSILMTSTKAHSGSGKYDHDVRLTIAELAQIIDMLAGFGLAEYEEAISEGLSGSVRNLNRLMAAASGITVSK